MLSCYRTPASYIDLLHRFLAVDLDLCERIVTHCIEIELNCTGILEVKGFDCNSFRPFCSKINFTYLYPVSIMDKSYIMVFSGETVGLYASAVSLGFRLDSLIWIQSTDRSRASVCKRNEWDRSVRIVFEFLNSS